MPVIVQPPHMLNHANRNVTVMEPSSPHNKKPLKKKRLLKVSKADKTVQSTYYGIEVTGNMTWQGWEPGKEYTKQLVLRNCKVKMEKIKYSLPSTTFFHTLFPKPLQLSPGTSFCLPVTFRPLEKAVYEDAIEFSTSEGKFTIPLKGILPQESLSMPEAVNLGTCAAYDAVNATFELKNLSELETPFKWKVASAFTMEPASGTLPPHGSCTIRVTFKPMGAMVYDAVAVCNYGPENVYFGTVKLEGIGKFPHIVVRTEGKDTQTFGATAETLVDFGTVPVGKSVEKWVELQNLSPVKAAFKVNHPEATSRIDTVFSVGVKEGTAPPNSSCKIPLIFRPELVGETSMDYLNVVAIGNISKAVIKCVGKARGPSVSIGSQALAFGCVDSGGTVTQTFNIVNETDLPASYQFMIDSRESVFKFEHVSGVLPPQGLHKVVVHFCPVHPINYYRRVACLVHNHDPLYVDMIGTCHTELVKPAVLHLHHLERYQKHVERGFSLFPPELLNNLVKENKLQLDQTGALMLKEAEAVEPFTHPPFHPSPMTEFFDDGHYSDVTYSVRHVSSDLHQADFGRCTNFKKIPSQVVHLTNHTKGKITVYWMCRDSNIFSVTPQTCDIPSEGATSFRVTFKPDAEDQFFGAELECFAFYKSMRDFKLVEDKSFCPPWCLTLTCIGHTFKLGKETFLPRFTLDSKRVVFPAVNPNESTYRTALLTNHSDTPIQYVFSQDETKTFTIKPSKGLIPPKSHQLYAFRMLPAVADTYRYQLPCRMNDNDKHMHEVTLVGSAESAEVYLPSQGELFFKSTSIGTTTVQKYCLQNTSRLPVQFEWRLNSDDRKSLAVEPTAGTILPNQEQEHTWMFSPSEETKYVLKPTLITMTTSPTGAIGEKTKYMLRVIGEGSAGNIQAEQREIDLQTVLVGSSVSKEIVLYNDNSCTLHYKLIVFQTITGTANDEAANRDRIVLELEKDRGMLPARAKNRILLTIRPTRRATYTFNIMYQLLTPDGRSVNPVFPDPSDLCEVVVQGVYPTLVATDARCYGSGIGISKRQLWSLFSLDNMNLCLDSDPADDELTYVHPTRHSTRYRPPVYTRAILDFNFSAAPVGSEECVVDLLLENTGTVTSEWAFLFPTDLQLELEYWAETGEFDEEELHQMRVTDNRLFSVKPKKGRLDPGQTQTVTFTYSHDMVGTDRLPVLFKLMRGREILLNFVGVTVDPERKYVHFPSSRHMFAPVPVGATFPPKQVYELYNGGAVPVTYRLDLTPLDLLQGENYNQKIFECLNPIGDIPPGRTADIEWVFSPFEAKTYMVDVPIHIVGGDTALITFTGVGYDRRIMGDTMPITEQASFSGVPGVQSVPVPGQLVFLNEERVSFGNMPLFSRKRTVLFLYNRSPDHVVSFEWHYTSALASQCLGITPVSGVLQPQESLLCKVVFTAKGVPSFYDLDLICEVTDETEMAKYKKELKKWEAEKERQKYEFTITEDNLTADEEKGPPSRTATSGVLRPCRSGIDQPQRSNSEGDLKRYQTLPPIRKSTPDLKKSAAGDDIWEQPQPPRAFLLHLGATARTHAIEEFQQYFPEEAKVMFIDRTLGEELTASLKKRMYGEEGEEEGPVDLGEVSHEEKDTMSHVLSNILRDLLDDPNFQEAVDNIKNEPIPYFTQFSEKPLGEPSLPQSPEYGQEEGERVSPLEEPPVAVSPDLEPELQGLSPEPSYEVPTPVAEEPGQERIDALGVEETMELEAKLEQQQALKRTPEFASLLEDVIENTMANIMMEASRGEVNLTARPRIIALPPSSASPQTLVKTGFTTTMTQKTGHTTRTKPATTVPPSTSFTQKTGVTTVVSRQQQSISTTTRD
ncbi:PREDICTED: cilia- and flagella-associated protein 65-like [Branchiostoma belcheri]|uniref:Cilia- and flagella-associated protein 65-like n=1 Tax=Branchiostoma belcheri TaxID=7741 RepID=A0A6P4YLD4_BRABE|nr:PREDICTED: cilia- and flagella-associated protein 65-like [Branchiostoma belcheri]